MRELKTYFRFKINILQAGNKDIKNFAFLKIQEKLEFYFRLFIDCN